MYYIARIKDKFSSCYRLIQLAADVRSKLVLLTMSFLVPIRNRLGLRSSTYSAKIRKFGRTHKIYLEGKYEELLLLEEILVLEEYRVAVDKPAIIIDLGSNIGFSIIYFALKYPTAKVFGFEPHPETYKRLQDNTRFLPNVKVFPVAVADHDGTVRLFVTPNRSISASVVNRTLAEGFIEVASKTLDTIVGELSLTRIDILKFDVEGAEFQILSRRPSLRMVRMLVGELHFDLSSFRPEDVTSWLSDFGVRMLKRKEKRFLIRAVNLK